MKLGRVYAAVVGLVVVGCVMASLVALVGAARDVGSRAIVTAIQGNSAAIARSIGGQLQGIEGEAGSLPAVVDMAPALASELQRHPGLSFFAVVASNGELLAFASQASTPVAERTPMLQAIAQARGEAWTSGAYQITQVPLPGVGRSGMPVQLSIGFAAHAIDEKVQTVVTDLMVAVLIAMLLVFEFLRFFSRHSGLITLQRFRAFALNLRDRNFEHRAHMAGADATARLGNALDARLGRLQNHYHALLNRWDRMPEEAKAAASHWHGRLIELGKKYHLHWHVRAPVRDHESARLRMGVFLICMSEEICRPFFAIHAANLDGAVALSPELLAGIPLSMFLLTWAISQPFGTYFLERFGPTACLLACTSTVGLGLLATAFTDSWGGLIALRAVTGFAFGVMLIFSQALLMRRGGEGRRASAVASYLAAAISAGICGPVIGGVLAGTLGSTFAFVTAGVFALAASLLVIGSHEVSHTERRAKKSSIQATLKALCGFRLLSLVVLTVMAGRLANTAILVMVVPLATLEMGESPALAGRLILLFFLGFFAVTGFSAKLSDRFQARKRFVLLGGAISAVACLVGYFLDNVWGLVLVCCLLGIGQAWQSGAQVVLVTNMMQVRYPGADTDLGLGIYRLIDRLGGALGPVVAAVMIKAHGIHGTLWDLGVMLALGTVLTGVAVWTFHETPLAVDRRQRRGIPL